MFGKPLAKDWWALQLCSYSKDSLFVIVAIKQTQTDNDARSLWATR